MEISRAIELLEHLSWDRDIDRNPYGDALNMAIDALKAQQSQESTTSDLISRQAARHALCKAVHKGEDIPCENQTASCLWTGTRVCDFVREIDALPTIHPEERTEAHACDLISRKATINAVNNAFDRETLLAGFVRSIALRAIRDMPSVQPERKKGEWIEIPSLSHTYICSECGRLLVNVTDGRNNVSKHYPYCHCGANMKGEPNERY